MSRGNPIPQDDEGREADSRQWEQPPPDMGTQQKEQSMNVNDVFTSKYLRAADLKGRVVKVTIGGCDGVEMNENGVKKRKMVLTFVGKDKGMVLNKTNAMVIADAYGPESSAWIGKELELRTEKVPFQGQLTDSLRVQVPAPPAADDDSIPF